MAGIACRIAEERDEVAVALGEVQIRYGHDEAPSQFVLHCSNHIPFK